ncbi:UDP-N-acetylmuramoyl-L-alanine--D-glutamate ligase [Candidatus Albibeggiatoa sp. nov. NOAA]|uniref:UDP-N-acetylmuramoyl-L-alanine--D-glutamate ligase n=1 Tax=Candidatus Albibeggiatoa sp. nov. NOAA TaxID=3162724 RepID=UPI0032F67841|nr:UDP-N-acetylmuramoyl-L-alanine--D-glutamate ligase [Thiotrichaceae bacterium]
MSAQNLNRLPSTYTVVMGMGQTGIACTRFLLQQHVSVCVMDNRDNPPQLQKLQQLDPNISYLTGHFDAEILARAKEIVISPGLSLQEPALQTAIQANVPIISEIELFARYADAPVVAITGSNGKSTVTTLLGEMAKQAGWDARIGGNLGISALDLITHHRPDVYILELSSFQLETTYSLKPKAAVVLNVSEDHMDRYDSFAHYTATKQRIYQSCEHVVVNADDPLVVAMLQPAQSYLSFSLHCGRGTFSICPHKDESYFARNHETQFPTPLLPVKAAKLQGRIMQANMLAALALGEAIDLPMTAMLDAIQTFKGLPHRCQWVAQHQGVDWFNDSKGTNVGATVAAIQGLERPGQMILIAGGEGKGADFEPLAMMAGEHLKACVLIGRDAEVIQEAFEEYSSVPVRVADSMETAISEAGQLAQSGDAVLLSPACASFDMFKGYEHRGQVFINAVQQWGTSI